ncbi:hypothetical protein AGMMS49982_09850 [Bacteroidia bacterium]|nr:hypothetical protein AGMMS49982_09850 [Bacteroidia bacterium]
MGAAAIEALLDDQRNVMMGIQNNDIVYVPFSKAIKEENRDLLNTLRILSIINRGQKFYGDAKPSGREIFRAVLWLAAKLEAYH